MHLCGSCVTQSLLPCCPYSLWFASAVETGTAESARWWNSHCFHTSLGKLPQQGGWQQLISWKKKKEYLNCLTIVWNNNLIFFKKKKPLKVKEAVGPKHWWQMNDQTWHTQAHNQVLGVQWVSFFCSLSWSAQLNFTKPRSNWLKRQNKDIEFSSAVWRWRRAAACSDYRLMQRWNRSLGAGTT